MRGQKALFYMVSGAGTVSLHWEGDSVPLRGPVYVLLPGRWPRESPARTVREGMEDPTFVTALCAFLAEAVALARGALRMENQEGEEFTVLLHEGGGPCLVRFGAAEDVIADEGEAIARAYYRDKLLMELEGGQEAVYKEDEFTRYVTPVCGRIRIPTELDALRNEDVAPSWQDCYASILEELLETVCDRWWCVGP